MTVPIRRKLASAAVAVATVVATLAVAQPASAGPVGIGNNGYNWSGNSPYAKPDTGGRTVRLWDSRTLWLQIEPKAPVAGVHSRDYTRLDALQEQIYAKNSTPLITLAGTPSWAIDRNIPSSGASTFLRTTENPEGNRVPTGQAWRLFVADLVKHNKAKFPNRPRAYQVWNEANIPAFFDGAPHHMAVLQRLAWMEIKTNDPNAIVVGPNIAGRQTNAQQWFAAFLDAPVGPNGATGKNYANVQSASVYPRRGGTPESALWDIVRPLRATMDSRGIGHQQLWDAEINYFLDRDGLTIPGGPEGRVAAGYVARTYLLAPWNRVDRTFWYRWDSRAWGGIYMVKDDKTTPTLPGLAYHHVGTWMNGANQTACGRASFDRRIVYCKLAYSNNRNAMAVWMEDGIADWSIPSWGRTVLQLDGSRYATHGGAPQRLTQLPILVRDF